LAFDSLQTYATAHKGEAEISPREQVADAQASDAIRQFDAKGCSVIIAHGHEFQQAAIDLTKDKAVKATIIVSGGDSDNPNFQSLAYDLSGASYQLGVIAGRVSKTGKLG